MDWSLFIDLFTNADRFLITIANDYGILIYIIMFMIFFLETGIVVMAFLPGDSLLFVAGAVTATGAIDPWWLTGVVTLGAILGNTSNFYIGSWAFIPADGSATKSMTAPSVGLTKRPSIKHIPFMSSTAERRFSLPVSFRS